MEELENELWPFRHFTYVTTHSPTLPSLYLRYISFSNPSVASLQPFFLFPNVLWYRWSDGKVTTHSPTLPSLYLRYISFSYPSVASLRPFFRSLNVFWLRWSDGKVTAHSPTLPSLYLRYSSFSYPCVASPTSQLILQPFGSLTLQALHLRHLASRPCHLVNACRLIFFQCPFLGKTILRVTAKYDLSPFFIENEFVVPFCILTLIVPRAWEIGYTQPCI